MGMGGREFVREERGRKVGEKGEENLREQKTHYGGKVVNKGKEVL